MAVRHGAICYLDEIVEARQDTTVVIHPLTDARRILPLEKHNEIVPAASRFPAHDLLQSRLSERGEGSEGIDQAALSRDRFRLSAAGRRSRHRRRARAGTDVELAGTLVAIAERSRNLQGHGLDEGASTRMLIHAGRLVRAGLPLEAAVRSSIVLPITDNHDIREALSEAIQACIP